MKIFIFVLVLSIGSIAYCQVDKEAPKDEILDKDAVTFDQFIKGAKPLYPLKAKPPIAYYKLLGGIPSFDVSLSIDGTLRKAIPHDLLKKGIVEDLAAKGVPIKGDSPHRLHVHINSAFIERINLVGYDIKLELHEPVKLYRGSREYLSIVGRTWSDSTVGMCEGDKLDRFMMPQLMSLLGNFGKDFKKANVEE